MTKVLDYYEFEDEEDRLKINNFWSNIDKSNEDNLLFFKNAIKSSYIMKKDFLNSTFNENV